MDKKFKKLTVTNVTETAWQKKSLSEAGNVMDSCTNFMSNLADGKREKKKLLYAFTSM